MNPRALGHEILTVKDVCELLKVNQSSPEASKPRLYQSLLVTAGTILTCYGLLTAASILLPVLRERIEANRVVSVIAFRDRIIVHSQPTVMTMTPRPIAVLPTAPVPTLPQSYPLSSMRRPAVPVSPGPIAVEPP
jgi:hypothetical protein